MKRDLTYDEVQALTEDEAKELAEEVAEVKGYQVYLVALTSHFGYSCLVFKNNHHIYYANDYELHHPGKTKEELKEIFIKNLNRKLFTEEEIAAPVSTYTEYNAKEYFLRNYYPMQVDHISIFHIANTEKEKKAYERSIKGMTMNPVGLCYMKDTDFIKHNAELLKQLQNAYESTLNNYEFQKSAFIYEMENHEYVINWQADYDTLSAFGNITYNSENDINKYFDELGFNQVQRKAYIDARKEVYKRDAQRA